MDNVRKGQVIRLKCAEWGGFASALWLSRCSGRSTVDGVVRHLQFTWQRLKGRKNATNEGAFRSATKQVDHVMRAGGKTYSTTRNHAAGQSYCNTQPGHEIRQLRGWGKEGLRLQSPCMTCSIQRAVGAYIRRPVHYTYVRNICRFRIVRDMYRRVAKIQYL